MARLVAAHPARFLGWIFLNPRNNPRVLDELERWRAVPGMIGVKLHPHWHDYRTEILGPVLRRAEELGLPVLIHLGFRKRGDFRAICREHPRLKVISAHAGFPFYEDLWAYRGAHPNLHVDLSSPYIDEALARAAVQAMGPERCLYGTDAPYGFHEADGSYDYGEIRRWVERMPVSTAVRERIFGGNLRGIVEIEPARPDARRSATRARRSLQAKRPRSSRPGRGPGAASGRSEPILGSRAVARGRWVGRMPPAMTRRDAAKAAAGVVDIRRLVTRAVVLPLVLMAVVAGWLAWQVGRQMDAARWVDRTDRVIARANELGRLIIDQETGVRAFLLTEDQLFLEPYEGAHPDAVMTALEHEINDPEQLARMRDLHVQYAAWAEATRHAIAHPAEARTAEALRLRKEEMDGMRRALAGFLAGAEAMRAVKSEQAGREAAITAVGTAALLVSLGVALALLSRRQLRKVAETYQGALARVALSEAALGRLVDRERAALTEAREAARMKDEFLSTLSHELRTPLTAILGWAAVLRTRARADDGRGASTAPLLPPSPEVSTRALAAIERNARAQSQLVDDLLDVSRIVNGKLRLDLQRMDLAAALRAAIDVVRFSAESKGVTLDAVLAPTELPMVGDAHRLQQVAWNLMSNAIKFTPRGGRVEARVERAGGAAQIVVRDTGEGITPEFLPYVFERFRQADASMKRSHGGLGLGLAIVKLIVEMHGGEVRAESAGPGLGATFTVTLPITTQPTAATEPAPAAASAPPPSSDTPLAGVRVLVIDDEPDALEVVSMILSAHGAEVTSAASGSDALGILDRAEVDVIVSDIAMPGLDGYDLLARIRRKRPLPAVALTAYARAEDVERARAAGFQRHLPKPVSAAQLVETINGLAREP